MRKRMRKKSPRIRGQIVKERLWYERKKVASNRIKEFQSDGTRSVGVEGEETPSKNC